MTIVLEACLDKAVIVSFEAECDVTTVIGDPVIFSSIVDGKVDSLPNNSYGGSLVVGLVTSKPSPLVCEVATMGILTDIATGLTRGKPVWVSLTGGLTTTKPATGDLQVLGNAISPTSVAVNIEMRKVKQTP